jgi:G patch domain-containing protein 1
VDRFIDNHLRYFNTVGSKEGWVPSTFISSRADRKKDKQNTVKQRPEDFMDEEDLAEAAEAQGLRTADGFTGLGSTEGDISRLSAFVDLFRKEGENIGAKLLKLMGWREGQGVGPKIRRKARLDVDKKSSDDGESETYLFAPENTHMVNFLRKNDHKGLGYDGEARLEQGTGLNSFAKLETDEETFGTADSTLRNKREKRARGGIGIGILNDTGSDDDDPYEIGPRLSYNRVIGGVKKKKKKPIVNGSAPPVLISKRVTITKNLPDTRKCRDGRPPLDGFVLSGEPSVSSIVTFYKKYLPPEIPKGWQSTKQPTSNPSSSSYLSTSEAARASKMDPRSRATLLGEAPLPGKSVFDFLSPASRDRLSSATGKTDLPPALGEIPKGYLMKDENPRNLLNHIPKLDKDIAVAALGRGTSGWMPYGENEAKRARYRTYLEVQAGIRDNLPEPSPNLTKDDWLKELHEFANCARLFKPMTGIMATRFTSSLTPKLASDSSGTSSSGSLISKPAVKVEDPAEAAAKMGIFGPVTRSTQDFYPTRLLCKRFNVKPPAHVQLDPEGTADNTDTTTLNEAQTSDGRPNRSLDLVSKSAVEDMLRESGGRNQQWDSAIDTIGGETRPSPLQEIVIDVERNESLEGQKASEAVFRSIFGDSDDDSKD